MPAEWVRHRATWIGWPHHEPDWPGKLGAIPWVYAEIVRVLAAHEPVEILCDSDTVLAAAEEAIAAHGVRRDRVRLHVVPTDRVWLRDSGPTGVLDARGGVVLLSLGVQRMGEVRQLPARPAGRTGDRGDHRPARRGAAPRRQRRPGDSRGRRHRGERPRPPARDRGVAAERRAGAQCRLERADYETLFAEWLGVTDTIWLGEGCVGDDTHGHIDDIARFVNEDTVVLAVEADPDDDNHRRSMDNLRRLELAAPARGPLRSCRCRFHARSP